MTLARTQRRDRAPAPNRDEVDAVVQTLVAEGKVRQDRAEAVLADLRAGVPV